MDVSCGRCGARWSGTAAAHCGAECHLTFTSVSAFDRHRRGGECVDPTSAGLVTRERAGWAGYGFQPADDSPWHSDSRVNGKP